MELTRPESQVRATAGHCRATPESMVFNSPFARRVPLFSPNIGVPLGLFSRNTSQKRSYRHERFCGKNDFFRQDIIVFFQMLRRHNEIWRQYVYVFFSPDRWFSIASFSPLGPQIGPRRLPTLPGYGTGTGRLRKDQKPWFFQRQA